MHLRSVVLCACLAAATALGCTGDDDLEQRCVDARARLANARVDMLGPPPDERLAADYVKHRENYERALGDSFVEQCTKRGNRYADCILEAPTPAATLDCARDDKARQALRATNERNP